MSSVNMKTDVFAPILEWVKSIINDENVTVILDRPNAPRPPLPYITLMISTPLIKVGSNDNMNHQDDTTWNISGQRRFTMSIRSHVSPQDKGFFDAQNMLIKLQDAVEDEYSRSILTQAGLAVWLSNDILDVTELLETGFEPRAQLDITFGIASNREVDLGAIEKVQIEGTVDDETEPEFQVPED